MEQRNRLSEATNRNHSNELTACCSARMKGMKQREDRGEGFQNRGLVSVVLREKLDADHGSGA